MPYAMDIFSGCGGLSAAIKQVGFTLLAAVEIDAIAAKTYKANHPEVNLIENDIRKIKGEDLLRENGLGKYDLDLLAGCSPCQGFSRLSKTGKSDKRNRLILEFVRLVEEMMPKVIFMENVPGLIKTETGKKIFKQAEKKLINLGYSLNYDIVDVVDYGVPQFRKRFVLIGSRIPNKAIKIPKSSHIAPNKQQMFPQKKLWLTVKDAIGEVPAIGNGEKFEGIQLHFSAENSPLNLERIQHIPHDGGSRFSLPDNLQLKCHRKYPKGFRDVYGRMTWNKPSPTLTGGCNNITKGRFIHPDQDRAISLYEAQLIQTFPPDYVFHGKIGEIALQIGNAVPVRFGCAMLTGIFNCIRED